MVDVNIGGWMLNPNLWFIVGFIILGLGMMIDGMDVALILGVPSLIISLLIAIFPHLLQTWVAVSLVYIALIVVGFFLLIRFKNNIGGDYDVNED